MKKVVLITGGTRGIGKECVFAFAKNGYNVIFTYKNSEKLAKEIENEVMNKFPENITLGYKVDVSSFSEMQNLKELIKKTFGGVDVLIANAGIAKIAPFVDLDEGDFDSIINTNLKGLFNSIKCVYEFMLNKNFGRIIAISSVWGSVGASCESLYSASKAAVLGFVKSLAKEFGSNSITVNAISPGMINTDMNNELSSQEKEDIISEIPLERIGQPSDVAAAALFLASNDASYITGQNITVDGGWKV
ncbi:MAG: 3-oxoacyl-ACP reductase FabG [Clostridia bacterium]|nr:3-oxoacyl-ACP reductase FabG [Clostridia bacterium]